MNNINFSMVEQSVKAMMEDPSLTIKNFNANVSWEDGVRNTLTIGDFNPITIDEPESLGGTNMAPNPVEYLLGAAASCFAIGFELAASQKGITLEKVDVTIEADLNAGVLLGIAEGHGGIINPKLKLNAQTSASDEEISVIAQATLANSPVLSSLYSKVELVK